MCRQRCLDLGLLKEVRWGVTLHRLKPPQVRERDDRGCFAAQMDHLVGTPPDRERNGHATAAFKTEEDRRGRAPDLVIRASQAGQ